MCGIGFVINYNKKTKMPLGIVGEMFKGMEDRGTDASGVYFERQGGQRMIRKLFKMPSRASALWKLIQSPETSASDIEKAMAETYHLDGTERLIMLHTRHGTKGSSDIPSNNMPIFSANSILIHNGMVHGERLKDYPYKGEVDSEEIVARIETNGLKHAIEDLSGSMAIVTKKFKEETLVIYRHGNPMDLLYYPETQLLIGCSKSSFVPCDYFGEKMNEYLFQTGASSIIELPEDTAYRVSITKRDITPLFEARPREYASHKHQASAASYSGPFQATAQALLTGDSYE